MAKVVSIKRALPAPGQLVQARNRRFVVTAVEAGQTGLVPQHLVSMSSVEDDTLGEELWAVSELEPGTSVLERASMPELTRFDAPLQLMSRANLTGFAFNLNIELGVIVTGGHAPAEAARHLDELIRLGMLVQADRGYAEHRTAAGGVARKTRQDRQGDEYGKRHREAVRQCGFQSSPHAGRRVGRDRPHH